MFDIKHVYQGPAAAALAVVAVASTAHSIDQQKAGARDQKRANQAQQRIQSIKAARERRKQVRDAQQAQAQMAAGAQASGTTQTSGYTGGSGSVQTQLGANLSFLDQVGGLTQQASMFNQRAATHSSSAATGQAVSGLAMQGASIFSSQIKPGTE
jgi:Flp pilus assembly protein TadB